MSITEIAIKRPSLIIVIFAVLGFLGFASYKQLSYELLPKFSSPFITISTLYPGAAPKEVENSVSKKIEDAVASLENVVSIRTTSQESFSMVMIELKQGADVDIASQDAQRKVNAIRADLPRDIEAPSVTKFSISELPIIRMAVSSPLPPTEFYHLVKNKIQPLISKVEGVAQITLIGGEEREIRVNVDINKLKAYNLSMLQISERINASNLDFPTGKVKGGSEQLSVRLAGKFSKIEDLEELVKGRRHDQTQRCGRCARQQKRPE
jgi:hydrophobic/amphiphilic exporter-1 (mainly G- bacteria), HAE1 family